MKKILYSKYIVLLLLFLAFAKDSIAQQYFPVVAKFTQLSPYPVYLADFSNPGQTNLSIQMQMRDVQIASRPIRLKIYIEGQGFLIESIDKVQGEPPLVLTLGQIYDIPAVQVANYFKQYNLKVSPDQYRKPFTEGQFRFGVEVIDFATNRPLSGIQWGNYVWITINEPPVWVLPTNAIAILPMNPQNINFQWAPRHKNVNDVEYEFAITDLLVNANFSGNVQNLFLSQPPYYKVRTRATNLNYNASLPPLIVGRTYAYRVQAIAKRGFEDVGVFRNNGFSEVQYFTYGEPIPALKPPTNLKIAWNATNKEADFNWKGVTEHKNFTVEIREKGTKVWKTVNITASNSNLYNSFLIQNLTPEKNYEVRVTGFDDKNQKATSTTVALTRSPSPIKQEELFIKGNVLWAYYSTEEKLKQEGTFLQSKSTETTPQRETKHEQFSSLTASSQKHTLDKAIVTLYSADGELTIDNFKTKNPKRIATVNTTSDGKYTFNGLNIKLLSSVKNLYVVAEYQGEVFTPSLIKIQINSTATGTKLVEDMTLLANTIRYSPKLLIGGNSLPVSETLIANTIEEVGVYRLKSVADNHSYLKQEGNFSGEKPTINYNNNTYVKVADFKETTTAAQLFYNKVYNDKFVLRVKQKDRKQTVFPINDIIDLQAGKYAHITDYFNYTVPNNTISGYVERKGEKNERVANVSVRILDNSVRTNNDGYFEIDVPASTPKDTKISISAIDPLNTNNIVSETAVYELKDISKTLVLNDRGYYVEGRVYGRDGKHITGANVMLKGQTVKTDADGYFSIACAGESLDDSVKATFDGYEVSYGSLNKFKKIDIKGTTITDQKKDLLKTIKAKLDDTQKDRFFEDNFVQTKLTPVASYSIDSVLLNHETYYRVIVYTNKTNAAGFRNASDSVKTVSAVLSIDGSEQNIGEAKFIKHDGTKEIWSGGYLGKVFKNELVVKVVNKKLAAQDTTYVPEFFEEEITVSLPKKYNKKDTVIVKVLLKPAMYFYGAVYDSTTFIRGVHDEADTTIRKPGDAFKGINSVEVAISGSKVMTDSKGHFKILVPKGVEFEVELSKTNFATSKYAISAIQAQQYTGRKRKDFYLLQQDKNIPPFITLLGFNIKVDKATKHTGKSYIISGTLSLNKGKLAKGNLNNIIAAGETTELNFKNIVVTPDAKDKKNAITTLSSINFVESEAKLLLFDYAPITLQGNPIGEPFVRLQHLDIKGTKIGSEGKIGASEIEFTQREMMGINFGKMELTLKDPTKEKKFGKFDDKLSDKDATKREKKAKEKQEEKDKTQNEEGIAKQKTIVESATEKEKKTEQKKLDVLENGLTAVPDKEPLLLAFAPVNLEELSDTKEYNIEFPQAATREETKDFGTKKDTTKKDDPYKDFIKIPVGPGGMVTAGIDQTSAVLKKSGVSMKGILLFPEIWRFKSNGKPLTIEKLEIDKKFAMKTAIIGKSDEAKKEITSFGVADTWMCYWNTVQIYNDFKGYGIGGTFNTDKENYININSLGFSVIEGRVYPNVDLSTPKDGFKFSKLRFKTVGKKNITIKGNPDDKSYEVEGSLRIEWDDSELKSSANDTTDRFGKRLSDEQITKNNQIKADEKKLEEENKKLEDEQAIITEKEKKSREEELAIQEAQLSKAEQAERRKRLQMYDTEQEKKDLQIKRDALAKLKEKIQTDKDAVAKAETDKKAEEDKKEETKKTAELKDEAAKTAVENGQQQETAPAKERSVGLKERLFPIEVQVFKWSTSGKFLISASLSQDALKLGPIAVKVRRIVYSRGASIKQSEINDLLKMSEDEVAKMNSTAKFNSANTHIDKDGKRIGATSEESQKQKEGASVDNLSLKAIEDKVAAENPSTKAWALGFAGGVEVDVKSINIDSDVSFYIADFDGKGHAFKMNEIMLKIDATSFRAYAKIKISTSGKKVGFEGEGEFEGAKIKAAIALKFYSMSDGSGIELGAALKVSTGPAGLIMGPITWTALGGGFDLNTADKKFSIFFLGDARSTGLPEKVTSYKKIRVSLDFDGKECGIVPVLRGSMELWSGTLGQKDEKICDVKVDVDFCRTIVICKIDCELNFSDKKVKVDALAFISPRAGFFLGAKVKAEFFGMNVNGLLALGIMCDTQHGEAPKELSIYTKELPKYIYQDDNRTISAFYLGVDAAYELKKNGGVSAFGVDLVTYSAEVIAKGKLNAGINFANGNFMINSQIKMEAEGKASILGFNMGGKLETNLELGGGRTNELGWNFRAIAAGKLELGAGGYENQACNDFSITGIEWCKKCIACCDNSWYCIKISVPYPCGGKDRFAKICLEGQVGFLYQEKGADEVRGWRVQLGGTAPGSNTGSSNNNSNNVAASPNSMVAESMLKRNESKTSPNGKYKLTLQEDGNVVLTKNGVKIWETNTAGKNVDAFKIQNDGNLVAFAQGGTAVWSSGTGGKGDNSSALVVQDDGNVVVYKNGQDAIWSSGTGNVFTESEISNSTIKAEDMLRRGQSLSSANGKYKVSIESDGNVVLRKDGNTALWATATDGKDVDAFKVQNDGNLVAYMTGARATWASGTGGKSGSSTVLLMQDDGNLVLYKSLESIKPGNVALYKGQDAIWSSNTSGK
jgi:hypothetical protein